MNVYPFNPSIHPFMNNYASIHPSMNNYASMHLSTYLLFLLIVHCLLFLSGMKVGFPLTQTCVLFAAMWGIFYFEEIDIHTHYNAAKFSISLLSIVAGAYLMALGN